MRRLTGDIPVSLGASAGLLVDRVLAVPAAVLLELDALAVVDLVLRRDVVAALARLALEGDVDAFCFNRELAKEDGTMPVAGETLSFKVTELKRSAKKVTLSHAKTYAAAVEARAERAASEADNTKKAVKKINSNIDKTTLGDIDALAALKSQLESK